MTETPSAPLPDLKSFTTTEDWLAALEEFGEEQGYFEPLGASHSAVLLDRSPVLLVTFETISHIRKTSERAVPLGHEIVQTHGWSNLAILAHEQTWFRDPAIYAYFDRLVDDGFFEDFDQVVFYGADMCGYAAAAFSVVSPGSTVLALSPQASLDPRVAEWDTRFARMRRVSFTDRYGFAPDMIEAADAAYVLYDPDEIEDSMHAALFTRRNTRKLRMRGAGRKVEAELRAMGLLRPLLEMACEGTLTPLGFHTLYRKRRSHLPYLEQLVRRLDDDGREEFVFAVCNNVINRMRAPRLQARMERLSMKGVCNPAREIEPAE